MTDDNINVEDDRIIRIVKENVMNNDEVCLHKSLMRLSKGSRSLAYEIVKADAKHWGAVPNDFHIDCALADLNGGCEVEWPLP